MSIKKQKIPVICYHNIGTHKEIDKIEQESKRWIIEKNFFEKQIRLIKKLGYKTLTLKEFEQWKKNEIQLPYMSMLITFDDGFLNVYKYALPILKKYQMNAVIFIEGNTVNNHTIPDDTDQTHIYMSKEIIDKCKKEYENIEFACHSYGLHTNGSVESKSYKELEEDLEKYKEVMGETRYFAYPFGHYTEEMKKVLKDNGYKLAFAFGPGKKARKEDDDFLVSRIDTSFGMKNWKFVIKMVLPFIY